MIAQQERCKVVSGVSFRRSIFARLKAASARLEEPASFIVNRALDAYLAELEASFASGKAEPSDRSTVNGHPSEG